MFPLGLSILYFRTHDGATVTFENVPSGTVLPVSCKRVLATGTTATGIVALLQ